jgi:hypothetical protein
MIDAVVLGGGRLPTGELTQLSKERLAAGVDALNRNEISSITIMGGHSSSWQSHALAFETSVAQLKYEYLRECGASDADILRIDEDTRDTIAEAFVFWKHRSSVSSVAVISTTAHLPRATYFFQRIGGEGKHVVGIGVPDSAGVLHIGEEAEYLEATRRVLDVNPLPTYESWDQWKSSQADLYDQFAAIRTKYQATEKVRNEAYGSVGPTLSTP